MFNPNDFAGTDSQRLNKALASTVEAGGTTFVIPERQSPDGRKHWLIDEAISLPANMEIIIDNCTVKRSDSCRDNIFRSANCGIGITEIIPIENIRITGRGNAVIEGADYPRSTGDSGKTLGTITYGTDAGKTGENPKGDWRNISILLAYVKNYSISNLTVKNFQCWAISMEYCSYGKISNIIFDTDEIRTFNGVKWNVLNQDGIDLRRGCHHIDIENISGTTGDDVVALTALKSKKQSNGDPTGTEISVTEENNELNHIHDITIRSITANSFRNNIRLLNNFGIKIFNVLIDGVEETSKTKHPLTATVRIGDANPNWGGATPLGDTKNITVRNVVSYSGQCVLVAGSLLDSEISNIKNYNRECQFVECSSGAENMKNVKISDSGNMF